MNIKSLIKKLIAMAKKIITKIEFQSLLFKKVNFVNGTDAELNSSQLEGARKQFPVGGDKPDNACLTADEVNVTYTTNGKKYSVTAPNGYEDKRLVPDVVVNVSESSTGVTYVNIYAKDLSARLYAEVISTRPVDEYDSGDTSGYVHVDITGLPNISGVKAKVKGRTPISQFPYYTNSSKYAECNSNTGVWESDESRDNVDIRNEYYVSQYINWTYIDADDADNWGLNIIGFTGTGVSELSTGNGYSITNGSTVYRIYVTASDDIQLELR